MSDYRVRGPAPLQGKIAVPGDKSISHRALILAASTPGVSTIRGLSTGEDVAHTRAIMSALGARITVEDAGLLVVDGGDLREPTTVLNCGNAATGIRLISGLVAGIPGLHVLTGDQYLVRRPVDRVARPLRSMGATVDAREHRYPPLVIRGGTLTGITYALPMASAQVKSAVLLAGLRADSETTVIEPAPSRAHTEEMLIQAGAAITVDGSTITLKPSELAPQNWVVPGDPSSAAFWVCAAAGTPDSHVEIDPVYLGPGRADFIHVLRRMGADIFTSSAGALTVRGTRLHATNIDDPAEIPGLIDEVPALAIAAALAEGKTTIRNAADLRVKESDRITTTADMLRTFGISVDEHPDGLDIHGGGKLVAGQINSHGDHRIAMSAAALATATTGTTVISEWDSVATSYPGFHTHLVHLTQT
ncbi:MAG: 3-phosphoshikimate 1-carboxyvinyltransferase [Pseudonocardiales bacterium]